MDKFERATFRHDDGESEHLRIDPFTKSDFYGIAVLFAVAILVGFSVGVLWG